MTEKFSERIEEFDELVHEALVLLSIARDSDLQRATITKLSECLATLGASKQEAIAQKNEDRANLVLGMECLAKALLAELSMWLLLKAEKPELAWENLVKAQGETSHAIRAHQTFADLENHAKHLDAIEKVVFPPQIFLSAGLIVAKQICSICGQDYEDCPHLVGLPYWGEFCFRRLESVVADHVAIVNDPANKLCRMTHFSVEGGRRNRMTWRVEAAEPNQEHVDGRKGLLTTGIVLEASDLIS